MVPRLRAKREQAGSAAGEGALEPVAEAGMGDGDQRLCPLAKRLSLEIGRPIFADDDAGVVARGGHRPVKLRNDREIAPPLAVDGQTMIDLPPSEAKAPRMKSSWPPEPLYWPPITCSELQAPLRST